MTKGNFLRIQGGSGRCLICTRGSRSRAGITSEPVRELVSAWVRSWASMLTSVTDDLCHEAILCEALRVVHHPRTPPDVAENQYCHGAQRMIIARFEEIPEEGDQRNP